GGRFPGEAVRGAGEHHRRGRILVIDHDGKVRTAIEAILTATGYRVRQALSVTEGARLIEMWSPRLIFLEQRADSKSDDAIQALWNAAGRRIAIVLMGAPRRDGAEFLVAEYLPKPFDVRELIALAGQFASCGLR